MAWILPLSRVTGGLHLYDYDPGERPAAPRRRPAARGVAWGNMRLRWAARAAGQAPRVAPADEHIDRLEQAWQTTVTS